MGARGPKPTPKPILEGRGSWRATVGGAGMQAKVEIPPCPKGLSSIARREWVRQSKILLDLGVIASLDRAALAVWCATWEQFLKATAKIKIEGEVDQGRRGRMISPWVKIQERSADRLLKYAAQFGFTPSARARINSVEKGEDDALGEFIAGKIG
jgi:P27 family predicted phage terminase small subunit